MLAAVTPVQSHARAIMPPAGPGAGPVNVSRRYTRAVAPPTRPGAGPANVSRCPHSTYPDAFGIFCRLMACLRNLLPVNDFAFGIYCRLKDLVAESTANQRGRGNAESLIHYQLVKLRRCQARIWS
jgi:hypothetical protein